MVFISFELLLANPLIYPHQHLLGNVLPIIHSCQSNKDGVMINFRFMDDAGLPMDLTQQVKISCTWITDCSEDCGHVIQPITNIHKVCSCSLSAFPQQKPTIKRKRECDGEQSTSEVFNKVFQFHLPFRFDVGAVHVSVEEDDGKGKDENGVRVPELSQHDRVADAIALTAKTHTFYRQLDRVHSA